MHGLVFAAFQAFTRSRFGAAVDPVWRAAPEFLTDAAYDDEEFTRLVDGVATATGAAVDEVRRDFGAYAGEHAFARLYPDFYRASRSTVPFLLTIEHRIHELVRATVPGAAPPRLHAVPLGRDGAIVSYTSERGLCDMLEGLIAGTARYYGETFAIEQVQCLHRGDPACVVMVQPA